MNYRSENRKKYETANPVKALMVRNFRRSFLRAISICDPKTILEAGCGEGMMTKHVVRAFPGVLLSSFDINSSLVEQALVAAPSVNVFNASVLNIPLENNSYELIICSEVLEHLQDPRKAMSELVRVGCKNIMLSVPHEPWFRIGNMIGFSHLRSLGNADGHIQHWSGKSFCRFLEPFIEIDEVSYPFPWILVRGHVRQAQGD